VAVRPRISRARTGSCTPGRHRDAVGALLLDHRLRHAQPVDAVVERADVLLERRLLDALERVGADGGGNRAALAVVALGEYQVGDAGGDRLVRLGAHGGVGEAHAQRVALARHAGMADVAVAQLLADVGGECLHALLDRLLHVDLQEEVHAAAQVQAEGHRRRLDRRQPVGRGGQQVERYRVGGVVLLRVERLVEKVVGAQLRVAVGEARLDPGRVGGEAGVGDVALLQRLLDASQERRVDLYRGFGRRHLHGRRLAVEVRHGVEQREQDRNPDQHVAPGGIAVHASTAAT
jgi:hypothetical protein